MSNLRQSDNISNLAALLRFSFDQQVKELYTAMPGIVRAYDSVTGRVDVAGALDIVTTSGERIERATITDVPLIFPSAGDYSIHIDVAVGDAVLLIFSMRDIEEWKDVGYARAEPRAGVMLERSAVAIAGVGAELRAEAAYPELRGLTITHRSGSPSVSFEGDQILMRGNVVLDGQLTMLDETRGTAGARLANDGAGALATTARGAYRVLPQAAAVAGAVWATVLNRPATTRLYTIDNDDILRYAASPTTGPVNRVAEVGNNEGIVGFGTWEDYTYLAVLTIAGIHRVALDGSGDFAAWPGGITPADVRGFATVGAARYVITTTDVFAVTDTSPSGGFAFSVAQERAHGLNTPRGVVGRGTPYNDLLIVARSGSDYAIWSLPPTGSVAATELFSPLPSDWANVADLALAENVMYGTDGLVRRLALM